MFYIPYPNAKLGINLINQLATFAPFLVDFINLNTKNATEPIEPFKLKNKKILNTIIILLCK